MSDSHDDDPVFGYLACLGSPADGVIGGYLIVSATGRPLEFHCTAPVVANRAQEILFGPTLRPYLLGEQVAATLINKAKIKAHLLLLNDPDATSAGAVQKSAPATAVVAAGDDAESLAIRIAASTANWRRLTGDEPAVWTTADESARVTELLERLATAIDVSEPFDRIEQAIAEVQRLGQGEATEREAA